MLAALVTFGILAGGVPAAAAAAGDAPRAVVVAPAVRSDSSRVWDPERMRIVLERSRRGVARVVGDFGAGEVEEPWADADGLHYDRLRNPWSALLAGPGGDSGPPPSPIPWDRLSEVQVRGNAAGLGSRIGLYAGGLAAIVYGSRAGFDTSSHRWFGPDIGALRVLLIPVAGGVAGALVGAAVPTWRTVHRAGAAKH